MVVNGDNVTGSGSEELVFVRFVKSRTCYDVMPYSSKLVVFDTQLKVSVFFFVDHFVDITEYLIVISTSMSWSAAWCHFDWCWPAAVRCVIRDWGLPVWHGLHAHAANHQTQQFSSGLQWNAVLVSQLPSSCFWQNFPDFWCFPATPIGKCKILLFPVTHYALQLLAFVSTRCCYVNWSTLENMKKFWGENVRSIPTSITPSWIESTESHMILGGGVAVCLLLSAHRAVIFAIAQLSCFLFGAAACCSCMLVVCCRLCVLLHTMRLFPAFALIL